jgi:hypothetical protein
MSTWTYLDNEEEHVWVTKGWKSDKMRVEILWLLMGGEIGFIHG